MKTTKHLISIITIGFLNLLMSWNLAAQNLSRDAEISFLGIDFSHVKLVNTEPQIESKDVVERHFKEWNDLFKYEPDKFNLNKHFKTSNMKVQTDFFNDINLKTKASSLKQESSPMVSANDVKAWVSKYNFNAVTAPYAIFMVATEFNKTKDAEIAKYYMVLLDKKSKTFYVSNELKSKPGGFGYKNYWASPFYKILKDANKTTKDWFVK